MTNPAVLKVISAIAFVISAIFTIRLFTSGSVGIVAIILSGFMALTLECAKIGFFYEGLLNKTLNPVIRGVMVTISVCLVLSSMFASSAYVQNESNKTKNREVKTSTQYKQLEESRNIQKDLYEQKKAEIVAVQSTKEKTISDSTKVRDSYPKDYYTVKDNLTKDIATKSTEYQAQIDQKSAELSKIANNLQSPIDTSKLNVLDSEGYSGIFKLVADMVSTEGSPVDASKLELLFFIILGILFEGVAILSAYLSQVKKVAHVAQYIPQVNQTQPRLIQSTNNVLGAAEDNKVTTYAQHPPMNNRMLKFTSKNSDGIKATSQIKKPTKPSTMTQGTSELLNDYVPNFIPKKQIGFIAPSVKENYTDSDWNTYVNQMFKTADENGGINGYKKLSKESGIAESKARKILGALEQENAIRIVGGRSVINKPKEEILRG